ncbi:hypothetical protein DPEC_G00272530 [Dallia pectoralis]|uniref:Uncharacterized protein n=1 Tax=Dallia pectoralis TaxID=75939 RepID=A0ACC2FQ91_DALPE|nr:hypothetical protein DPEC_G00272530 [Dallia pectoralis]
MHEAFIVPSHQATPRTCTDVGVVSRSQKTQWNQPITLVRSPHLSCGALCFSGHTQRAHPFTGFICVCHTARMLRVTKASDVVHSPQCRVIRSPTTWVDLVRWWHQ